MVSCSRSANRLAWHFILGIICVCVFAVITGAFKNEPALSASLRNGRQIVWNGFITSHPQKLLLSWTKKQPFSFGFVIWNTRHHVCSTQLPDQVLPTLFQWDWLWLIEKLGECARWHYMLICIEYYLPLCEESILSSRFALCIRSAVLRSLWICQESSRLHIYMHQLCQFVIKCSGSKHINNAPCGYLSKCTFHNIWNLLNVATESGWQQFLWITLIGLKTRLQSLASGSVTLYYSL